MDWTRAKDWLIGATGMALVLGVALVILWWGLSDPADAGGPGPAPTASAGAEDPSTTAAPPATLLEDETWFADLVLEAGTVVTPDSTLRDVRAVGQDVVVGPDRSVAARLVVDATVPFEVVADELGDDSVVRAAGGGEATVVRTVDALGREVRVTATGTVDVQAGRLVLEPRSIDIGGPDFLSDATAAVVRRFVTIEHDIDGLPAGLVLEGVTVQTDGFRANLRGEDVRLAP